ncbi:MAG TPA: radical SAM protein [Opitutales bacterium]|jgi:biotin synthase|nr:radical SAM protein [Opitutales bacterium]
MNATLEMHKPSATVDLSSTLEEMLLARGTEQAYLHEQAEALTRTEFGNRVFIRGVVEISNYCRQNCHYCGMRRSRSDLERYRIPLDVLCESLINHRPAYVTDINLQAGEDPKAVREIVLPLLKELRKHTKLGLSVGLGTLDAKLCDELREAGATFYIIKFETADETSYQRLESPGKLATRLDTIRRLAATGWRVSSGFIAGLPGETVENLAASLKLISELPLAGSSVSPFIPGSHTPLAQAPAGDLETALNCVALLRLRSPRHIIPAVSAFGNGDIAGYVRALRSGANLATVNLTPDEWRGKYPIYTTKRWILDEERLTRAIDLAGRHPCATSLSDHLVEN